MKNFLCQNQSVETRRGTYFFKVSTSFVDINIRITNIPRNMAPPNKNTKTKLLKWGSINSLTNKTNLPAISKFQCKVSVAWDYGVEGKVLESGTRDVWLVKRNPWST